jgi:sulfatase modifying factor 1
MLFFVLLSEKSAHMKSIFLRCASVVLSISMFGSHLHAGTVTFGSGANAFNMEFVTIGNPGNAADTTGSPSPAGAVGYTYGIGKFEVSRDMITKFNASQSLEIILEDMTSYGGNGANKPATGISWNEAARFINWLNTSNSGFAAYKFTTGGVNDNIALWTSSDTLDYDASNPYRSKRATYVLPSYNEWYKAAYYKGGSLNAGYWIYTTGSNTVPTPVASGTGFDINGNKVNEAVYNGQSGPADVTQASGLSPYGVTGAGGNVAEWEESSFDLSNSLGDRVRGLRGGDWLAPSFFLSSSTRFSSDPSSKNAWYLGFRVASLSSSAPPAVPEPSMMVIGTLFGLGGLVAKKRIEK